MTRTPIIGRIAPHMATASPETIREELRELGKQRKLQAKEDGKLATKIRNAVQKADGKITVTEQADLLGMERTTLYRVYMK